MTKLHYLLSSAIIVFNSKILLRIFHLARGIKDTDTIVIASCQQLLSIRGPVAG